MSAPGVEEPIRAVDLFCGAGGLSTGIAKACEGLDVDVELTAVNHWDRAIETHEENHPWATHHHAKVEELYPPHAVESTHIDLLGAAPECTHFSSARGGQPKNPQKRASPWHVLRWLETLHVENFVLENVPEIRSWGPVDEDGQVIEEKKGETFDAYVNALHSLGYNVEWRKLNAANHGDATSRERLFLIGRLNHRPEFPSSTHSEAGEVPGTQPHRPAADIIDWSDPGESIWTRSRPLVNNTMARIAEGIRRHGDDRLEPLADAVASLDKDDVKAMQERVVPAEYASTAAAVLDDPFLVALDGGDGAALSAQANRPTARPMVLGQHGGAVARDATDQPLPTVATAGAISHINTQTFVLPRNQRGGGLHSNATYDPAEAPLHTVTAKNHDGHLVSPYLVPFYSEGPNQRPRTHDLVSPLPTVTATGSDPALTTPMPYLIQYNNGSGARSIAEPLPTVTTKDRFALCVPDLYPWGLDVRFRMLKPRELASAMGFPQDYEFAGNKTETTEQIGNAIPVNLAASLVERLLLGTEPTLESFTPSDQQTGVTDRPDVPTPPQGEPADD